MPPPFGVTPAGFNSPTLDEIVADIDASLRADLGNGINLIAPSVFATIVGIVAEREFTQWQAQEAVYNSQYPNTASDQSLDNVASITGTTRDPATFGTVTLTVNLNAGVTLPAGKIVSAGANTAQWATTVPVTNSGGGPANESVVAKCQTAGPIQAVSGSLTTIVTPFSGWNSVTNALDAAPGQAEMTDAGLRAKRAAQLASSGNSTVDAIRAHILAVPGVTSCNVFDNPTDTTDGNGLTPHSIKCLVQGGADADIEAAIWANNAAGTATLGSTSGTVIDSQGFSHTVHFQRPTAIPIYVTVELNKGSGYAGDAAVKAAVVAFGATFVTGQTVIANQFFGPVYAVSGVAEITDLDIGTAPSPETDTDITIGIFQIATFDTSRVVVTST